MAKRVSIEVPGLAHDHPLPAACRKGPFLISSGISGKTPWSGAMPEGIDVQCAQMFATMRTIMEVAGGSTDDIIKVTVWLKDLAMRDRLNVGWLELFPDEHSRPARHTFNAPDLPGTMLVQCDLFAVMED